jgi:hypothetical protein
MKGQAGFPGTNDSLDDVDRTSLAVCTRATVVGRTSTYILTHDKPLVTNLSLFFYTRTQLR